MMGQQEVLKVIEDLGMTSLEELREFIDLSIPSITKSLSSLNRFNDIYSEVIGRRTVYFSQEIWEELIYE